jgi:O-acetyl-ADP-ribose deacetylase (regulator of RNase III)
MLVEKKISNKILRLVKDDITERKVDAIVNAANSYLKHGGVAAIISRKGGPQIQIESDKIGFVPTGSAVITTAGKLPCKVVIHAVGPRMGEGDEDTKLKKAIENSLKLADKNNLKSISIPAVSSGIFGFPKDRCANILVNVAKQFAVFNTQSLIGIIEFCIYDDETFSYFEKEFQNLD